MSKADTKPAFDPNAFRREFKQLDDAALLGVAELGALTGQTTNGIYREKKLGRLPPPAIERHRLVRWTAGQVRAWLSSLAEAAATSPAPRLQRRMGRRRAQTGQEGGVGHYSLPERD